MPIPTVGQSAEVAPDLATLVKEKMAAAMVTDAPIYFADYGDAMWLGADVSAGYAIQWMLEGPR